MIEFIRKNTFLIIGVGIPVAMVLLIAAIIYVPRVISPAAPPAHDILYVVQEDDSIGVQPIVSPSVPVYPGAKGIWPKYRYRVDGGHLVREENLPIPAEYATYPIAEADPSFYLYRVSTGESLRLSFDEAAAYRINTATISPDGWEIVHGDCGGEIFPFFGSSCNWNDRFLKKGHTAFKMDIPALRDGVYREPTFFWIVE